MATPIDLLGGSPVHSNAMESALARPRSSRPERLHADITRPSIRTRFVKRPRGRAPRRPSFGLNGFAVGLHLLKTLGEYSL
jgi:hypothetical protein